MQDLGWKLRSCLKKLLGIHQKQTSSFAGNHGNIKEKMMTVPKPSAPRKKAGDEPEKNENHRRKAAPKSKPAQPAKKAHAVVEHMTHRPFAEALKDFFTKETN